jgi:hypothetical protein
LSYQRVSKHQGIIHSVQRDKEEECAKIPLEPYIKTVPCHLPSPLSYLRHRSNQYIPPLQKAPSAMGIVRSKKQRNEEEEGEEEEAEKK